jgi:hypothetical protein
MTAGWDPLHGLAKKPANQKQQHDLRDEEGCQWHGWRLIRRECAELAESTALSQMTRRNAGPQLALNIFRMESP